jgi:high-affinity Fe2+/Pb2+ permease
MQLNNIKVGTRLAAGYGLIVAFLIGITLLAYFRLMALDDSIRLIARRPLSQSRVRQPDSGRH